MTYVALPVGGKSSGSYPLTLFSTVSRRQQCWRLTQPAFYSLPARSLRLMTEGPADQREPALRTTNIKTQNS